MNDLMKKSQDFLEKVFFNIHTHQIDVKNWPIDHLCYRTSSFDNYQYVKDQFQKWGELLIESHVNGRPISTYKLTEPILFQGYIIPLVEVPCPKLDKETREGFEHIEFVIDCSFAEIQKNNPHCQFETKGMQKKLNPDLEIEFTDCAIKFHHQSLEEIINIEKCL